MLEIRPCTEEAEERASLDIYNAVWPWDAVSLADVHSFRESAEDYLDMVAWIGREAVGSCAVAVFAHRPGIGLLLLTVLPVHRRPGFGTALYHAASDWGRERALFSFDATAPENDAESIRFAERRGFVVVERNSRLVLELDEYDALPLGAPEGISIVSWAERPDVVRGIYEVACEGYADVPGRGREEMPPFEHWLTHDMQGSGDRPEATFVALAGDEVAGYAKFSLTEAQPNVAFHDMTAVKRSWRGKGIAGALKRAELQWAKRAGYERVETRNAQRAAPPHQRTARLPSRAGKRDPARPSRP